ncbi:MAG TPA: heavy-metal-associated domain-containing protein [Flavisolibacter sp.]|nr:heavy-metal-associated domain-containing protein [Flavisolibacter sp.]
MKKIVLSLIVVVLGLAAQAQITKVSLQASGLTCSMCSKAVLNALEKVPAVGKVQVDIKNQQYNISFTDSAQPDFDALAAAVQDAGFAVASFKVTANLEKTRLQKDQHVLIGGRYFHFLNAANQELNGPTSFTIVDKAYTSAKTFKKYSGMSTMECVQTGKTAKCCKSDEIKEETRIFHAIM